MGMLRGTVADSKSKSASKASPKPTPSAAANKHQDVAAAEEEEEEEEPDDSFDAFFEAERPGLVASGFPDDDVVLLEEARARYKYIVSKAKSPAKPVPAAKQSTETGGKEVFLPSKLPDAYAATNGMVFVRKTD
eukprot:2794218-Prymnesium_polylepis.1